MSSDYLNFSDLPKSILRPLTVDEVAAVIGVSRNTMIRLVKNGTLPKSAFPSTLEVTLSSVWISKALPIQ